MRDAALVIGHGGAGTALDSLRAGCALLIVTNDALMHSHQAELATRLAAAGRARLCAADTLLATLQARDTRRWLAERRVALPPPRADLVAGALRSVLPRDAERVATLAVLGSGGHTAEMLALLDAQTAGSARLRRLLQPRAFVAATSDRGAAASLQLVDSRAELLRIPRSREVHQSYLTSVWTSLRSLLACFPLLTRRGPFSLLLTNGPGTALPLIIAAWLLSMLRIISPVTIVFIESVCRVQELSLTGRILINLGIPHLFVVQWPELQKRYPSTVYIPVNFGD